jgi:hypothetical protein
MNEGIFTIEIGSYGFMLDTNWCYIALSWQLIITLSLLTIGYKVYKAYKQTRNNSTIDSPSCNTTNDANSNLWGE